MGCGCAKRREAIMRSTDRTVKYLADTGTKFRRTVSPRLRAMRKQLRK
jgi:hypothetical protein